MLRKYIIPVFFLLFILFPFRAFGQQQSEYAGIPSQIINEVYTEQKKTQWCWAASIQIILNYYGIDITQEEIVNRAYGRDRFGNIPDMPANYQVITENLNNWIIEVDGERYQIKATLGEGAPPAEMLIEEMEKQHPVLFAYTTGFLSGHAVVCTGVNYRQRENGPAITKIIVRDPWENKGRLEYSGPVLARKLSNYWTIRVVKL